MKRLLLTGASGFLGWNICRQMRHQWAIYGIFSAHPFTMDGVAAMGADLTDTGALARLFAQIRPDALIHAAALSTPNLCEQQPEAAARINVEASRQVARLCADAGIPCLFTSTDLVFDGRSAPYREEDPPCPINRYGEQKAMAEEAMRRIYPEVTICRMPLMFGAAAPAAQSFIQPMIRAAREGRTTPLFTDEFRTPVSAMAAVQAVFLALGRVRGILHCGGTERVSRYAFGCLLAEALDLPMASFTPSLQAEVPMAAPRPADVSLDSSKAFALGFAPGPLREQLRALTEQM